MSPFTLLVVLCVGCGESSAPPSHPAAVTQSSISTMDHASGRVALIDLNHIARELGEADALADVLRSRKQVDKVKLESFQSKIKDRLNAQRTAAGETPSAEQARQLADLTRQMQQQLRQLVIQLQRESDELRRDHINRLQDRIRPIALRVAQRRGISIVLMRNENVLHYDDASDITDDVLKALHHEEAPSN
jgi:Skp family chaperone for outer membrane proteins